MKKMVAWFLGACATSGALALAACSSNNGFSDDGGTDPDGAKKDTGVTMMDTGTTDGGGGMDGGAGSECGAPASLHPGGDSGIYCPFSAVDGGKTQYCKSGTQHCCEPAMGTSSCLPTASACTAMETDWRCEDPATDCPGNTPLCCGTGTPAGPDPGCQYLFVTGFKGTKCAATCGMGEFRVCESDSQCPNGQTCKPTKAKGNQFGICQ